MAQLRRQGRRKYFLAGRVACAKIEMSRVAAWLSGASVRPAGCDTGWGGRIATVKGLGR